MCSTGCVSPFEEMIEKFTVAAIKELKETKYTGFTQKFELRGYPDIFNQSIEMIDKGEYLTILTKIGSKFGVRLSMVITEDIEVNDTRFNACLEYYTVRYRKVIIAVRAELPTPPGPGTPYTVLRPVKTLTKKAA